MQRTTAATEIILQPGLDHSGDRVDLTVECIGTVRRVDAPDLDMIYQILADAGQIVAHLDSVLLQQSGWITGLLAKG